MRGSVIVLALALVAFSSSLSVVSAQNTFCERYTQIIFHDGLNATWQRALVSAVVTRAFTGATVAQTGSIVVTGLYHEPNNARYFNGSAYPQVDYLAASNAGAYSTLIDHLVRFFMFALQCRAGTAAFPWTTVSLQSKHAQMGINLATESAFIGQVAASLISYGVPSSAASMADELVYVVALMQQFNRYTQSDAPFSICMAADCPLAFAFAEFDTSSTGSWSLIYGGNIGSTSVTISQGDSVHWNLGLTDGVIQTGTSTSTQPLSAGVNSGTGIRSYTVQFNFLGAFYFYNAGSPSNRCTVNVVHQGSSTAQGPTTGTGSNSFSAASPSVSSSIGVVTTLGVAALVAAITV